MFKKAGCFVFISGPKLQKKESGFFLQSEVRCITGPEIFYTHLRHVYTISFCFCWKTTKNKKCSFKTNSTAPHCVWDSIVSKPCIPFHPKNIPVREKFLFHLQMIKLKLRVTCLKSWSHKSKSLISGPHLLAFFALIIIVLVMYLFNFNWSLSFSFPLYFI